MGFDINRLMGLEEEDPNNLPPVPLRNDYVPSMPKPPVNPLVLKSLAAKYPDAGIQAPQEPSAYEQFNKQFSPDNYKKALADAEEQKSGLGMTQFAAGLGDAIAGKSPSQTAQNFDSIRKGIDERTVGAFEKQKANAIQDISTKKALEGGDKNSARSKVVQKVISQNWGKQFTPEEIAQFTADDADNIYKPMELRAKLDQAKAAQEMAHEDRMSKNKEKSDIKQQQAYTEMRKAAETFRGNKAVQNANEAIRNSDSAMEIINSVKNYDQLTPTQYNLLTAEVAKIATGGAATEGSIHDARASTLMSKAANFWQSVSGKPTGAQLGEFVQQNKDYLQHLNSVNHKFIDDFRGNNAKAYRGRVTPDQYNEYMTDFGPQQRGGGKITVTNGKETLQIDPSDLAHAKADGYMEK